MSAHPSVTPPFPGDQRRTVVDPVASGGDDIGRERVDGGEKSAGGIELGHARAKGGGVAVCGA